MLRYLICTCLAVNGLLMLTVPAFWFNHMPGVGETGPANTHLVRDVGCAYLVAAAGLLWRAVGGPAGTPAAMTAALFLLLHMGVHLWETAIGMCGWRKLLQDTPGVVLPGLLVWWLSRPERNEVPHG